MKGGPPAITSMRFPEIRLVERTENLGRFESVVKKNSDCNSRALTLIKAPTRNSFLGAG